MDNERRKSQKPIPNDLKSALNEAQLIALPALERFGWELKFVRRPLFQDVLPVVFNADGTTVGVLEEDGRLNLDVDVQIRGEQASESPSQPRVGATKK